MIFQSYIRPCSHTHTHKLIISARSLHVIRVCRSLFVLIIQNRRQSDFEKFARVSWKCMQVCKLLSWNSQAKSFDVRSSFATLWHFDHFALTTRNGCWIYWWIQGIKLQIDITRAGLIQKYVCYYLIVLL